MRVTQHASNNDVLRAPSGSTIEECRPAPITRTLYADGSHSVSIFWQLNESERLVIAKGGLIKIEVLGQTMPPLLLEVSSHD